MTERLEHISPLGQLTDHLHSVVAEARDFATRQEMLVPWVVSFDRALEALRSKTPEAVGSEIGMYARPIVAVGALDLPARRLFAAAQRAWVFGAMGSWNDVSFKDVALKTRYDKITTMLHEAVVQALIGAVNASDSAAHRVR